MEIIHNISEWQEYVKEMSTYYKYDALTKTYNGIFNSAINHYPLEPSHFPCIVSSVRKKECVGGGGDCREEVSIDHEFLYLFDISFEMLYKYKKTHKRIERLNKKSMAVYLLDKDPTIRKMAEEIWKQRYEALE